MQKKCHKCNGTFFVRSYTDKEEEIRRKVEKMENYRMNCNCSCSIGNSMAGRQNMCRQKEDPWEKPVDKLPLAMGYVPMQRFGQTYDLRTGLQAGTIFPDLHKPFCGKGGAGC